ncbi:hypothetical protein P280DRAFT_470831 [Massarina eburnea CBS 473.64]|uniref:Uncharacterized protein n=1 Tax=Massarina eburnea CBS 473.64 TaxID=1395130 RepID=A0A6A6RUI8_9PLEO|nr:hypothetical protein P280DRAFT_470831 [Massarina eburnea CBS 473.64]
MKISNIFHTVLSLAFATIVSARDESDPPNLGYKELFKLQNAFYEKFLYPNNVKEAESINSTVFSENIQGRVSDTRNFFGRELNTEYIFGLFTPNNLTTFIGIPIGPYEIVQFTGNKNIASATTRIYLQFPSFDNITLPIVVDTWMTWNEAKEVTQYDVTFRWFGFLLQTLVSSLNDNSKIAPVTFKEMVANSVCATHTEHCTGANQQYDNAEACYKFLTEEIRVGDSFELGMNTLLCRNIHEIMVRFRPEVHCSHIGRSGGGQCADEYTYKGKVEESPFTNSPWVSAEE